MSSQAFVNVLSHFYALLARFSALTTDSLNRAIMSSSNAPVYADNVVNQVTGATSVAQLSHTLKNGISKEAREALLISFLSNGQDPLAVLDVQAHTLGVLYIL